MSGAELSDRPGAGDKHRPGTIASVWSHRRFRTLYLGTFASNVGTWMQNVVIGPFALLLTKSPTNPRGSASFVGTVISAQFLPTLLLAVVGGVLANRLNRKRMLLVSQTAQMLFAFALAWMAFTSPSKIGLFLGVLGTGIAVALSGPSYQAVMPGLVPKEDMPGLISLNSAQINGSRVVGPLLMVALAPLGVGALSTRGMGYAFLINAFTYLFAIQAIVRTPIGAPPPRRADEPEGFAQLLVGFRRAREHAVAGPMLLTLFFFSAFCLPYVGQFATVAERAFGMKSDSTHYTWLYGTWGLGACLGALSMGTIFSRMDKRVLIRRSLIAFAVALAAFSQARGPAAAFPIGFVLGITYFSTTTAMATVMQSHLSERDRAPLLALWIMAFGGTIPIGAKIGGTLMDRWSTRGVLLIGSAVALALAVSADFRTRTARFEAAELARRAHEDTDGSAVVAS